MLLEKEICASESDGEAVLSAGVKTKLTVKKLHWRMGHIAPDAVRKLALVPTTLYDKT